MFERSSLTHGNLKCHQQDNVALGMVHSIADASKAQNENLGALADGMFANPDFQRAVDHFVSARAPYARPAAHIRSELSNIGVLGAHHRGGFCAFGRYRTRKTYNATRITTTCAMKIAATRRTLL
jgi:hypothetical protein